MNEFHLNKVPEDVFIVWKHFCHGTTCEPYCSLITWNAGFIYLHHKSHSTYVDRMTGSVNCPSYHLIANRNNPPHPNDLRLLFPEDYKDGKRTLPNGIALLRCGRLKTKDKQTIKQLTGLNL